ncbi:hypothetical protein [Weissella cibaria]|uniref:hypothetical protein n=1 Tax=Weissella cibaria TaxID=137591 RepID=UPI0005C2E617|nr:hypothetical protein [Weissella cibaria]KIU24318.1 hypothetical protein ff3pr_00297 [Weissella cibaria]MBD1501108.1 hypothetical protein [Weissella cibaria]MDY2519384.1 hypothetical protein [Weissella cibaria]WCE24481.1 hypothetical protein PKU16_08625 [Weissella cibaria]WCE26669.1 hypothetical protein PKU15_08625 [Weissella cibaria]
MVNPKERYVTYEAFNDFKHPDFQEVKDDIKDLRGEVKELRGDVTEIRVELTELRGDMKVLTQRMDGIVTSLNWYKYVFVLVVLLPFIERWVSRFI